MQIRPMTIQDYDEVFAMWQITTKRALSKADERDQIERYLLRNAGMSQVAHHMAVLPDYRRRHIGHRLAEKAIEMISRDGIDKTHIFCYQNNETGQNFWKDFGFEKRDDVFVFSYVNSKQTKEGIEQ